jgi:arsenate reductase
VTVARTLSDSFAGIRPASAPMFILMQLIGAAIAYPLIRFLYPTSAPATEAPPAGPEPTRSRAPRSSPWQRPKT